MLAVAEGNAQGSVRALEAAGLPVTVDARRARSTRCSRASASWPSGSAGPRRAGASSPRSRAAAPPCAPARAGRPRPRTLLLVWPDPPQAAGGQTFLNDVLTEAGADNLVGDRRGWPVLSGEYVATAPVELLVVPDSAETRPAWDARLRVGAALARAGRARPASCASTSRS